MKNRVVIFGTSFPKILTGINPDDYKGATNVAINPDLSKLIGIPPHYWKLQNGQIVEMSPSEKQVITLQAKQQSKAITLKIHSLRRDVTFFLLGLLAANIVAVITNIIISITK